MSDLPWSKTPANCSASRIIMRIQHAYDLTDDRHIAGIEFLAEIA